jgi:predicted AlkP superfamily phosphohydrolase/phosphomutase
MSVRLAVLGWDSATFDVVDALVETGHLPTLAGLQERGFRAPLRSTWPPMTDCAWTSAFTGVNPGAHGIFGSWYRAPGAYACRYFSSRDRRATAVWELAPDVSWVVMGVPMTYPPSRVNGAMVSTYGAPPGARFCEPPSLQEELSRRWPVEDLMDRAPHSSLERFLEDLLRGISVQADALLWLSERTEAEAVVAVFPQVDRAQHFFWRFRAHANELSDAVERVYEGLDRATGRLVDAFDAADVLVVSDHGAGPLHGDVNVGAWLVRKGRASYRKAAPVRLLPAAWALPPGVRRLAKRLAPGLARKAFAANLSGQLGPFEWTETEAFVGWHGDLWLNLRGREEAGTVPAESADEVLDALSEDLLGIEDPRSGRRVFNAVHRRADVYSGSASYLAPDAMLDSWSPGYRVAPGRESSEDIVVSPAPLTGVGEPWSADHRPLGIFVGAGPRVRAGRAEELSLYDVCPTALALLEGHVPEGLDGRVAAEAFDARWLEAHPVRFQRNRQADPARTVDAAGGRSAAGEYTDEEAAAVASHLKDLGYIE